MGLVPPATGRVQPGGADIEEPDVQTTISVTDRVYVLDYGKVVLRGATLKPDARDGIKKLDMGG